MVTKKIKKVTTNSALLKLPRINVGKLYAFINKKTNDIIYWLCCDITIDKDGKYNYIGFTSDKTNESNIIKKSFDKLTPYDIINDNMIYLSIDNITDPNNNSFETAKRINIYADDNHIATYSELSKGCKPILLENVDMINYHIYNKIYNRFKYFNNIKKIIIKAIKSNNDIISSINYGFVYECNIPNTDTEYHVFLKSIQDQTICGYRLIPTTNNNIFYLNRYIYILTDLNNLFKSNYYKAISVVNPDKITLLNDIYDAGTSLFLNRNDFLIPLDFLIDNIKKEISNNE